MLRIPLIHNYTYVHVLARTNSIINAQDYFAGLLAALIKFPERLSVHWSSA